MIWLVGRNGMLARQVAMDFEKRDIDFVSTSSADVDITDENAVLHFASKNNPDWIVNCAAYTAVDVAENDENAAFSVNSTGAKNLALAAKKSGATFIHISTDYVFDGTGNVPYKESDVTNPKTVYGKTKLSGEKEIENVFSSSDGRFFILRTSLLYAPFGNNFALRLLENIKNNNVVKVVTDQKSSPTLCSTLSYVVCSLISEIEKGKNVPLGIYNVSDFGEATRFEFATEFYALLKQHGKIAENCEIVPCKTSDLTQKAPRPKYSVLDKTKIQNALEIALPDWKKSLKSFIISL